MTTHSTDDGSDHGRSPHTADASSVTDQTATDDGSRSSTDDGSTSSGGLSEAVRDHPWLEPVTRVGWFAKAAVYLLMGVTAVGIARLGAVEQNASPEGSVVRVAEAPLGRFLLVALTVGLALYAAWRILSVIMLRGTELSDWADRLGYTFSAGFYLLLAFTAGRAALSGQEPADSNTVESLSATVMEQTLGRWLVGAAGLVTVAVGLYFVVRKGVLRSFVDDVDGVSSDLGANDGHAKLLLISGIVGWIGRGLVTVMVGFFVVRAAYRFDADDARGFDRALREVAGSSVGATVVFACAAGLIAYGFFCFLSAPRRSLDAM